MPENKTIKLFIISIFILILSITISSLNGRFIPINCCICGEHVRTVSWLECKVGPWEDIPCIHQGCHKHLAITLAPNCNMSIGEWLEIRGYNPRAEEEKGMAFEDIMNKNITQP
jgi:hypothetical protein